MGNKTALAVCMSAKGGLNTPITAMLLTLAAARLRREINPVLIDADFDGGKIAHMLRIADRTRDFRALALAVEGRNATGRTVREYIAKTPWGIDTIAAPLRPDTEEPPIIPGASAIVKALAGVYHVGRNLVVASVAPDWHKSASMASALLGSEGIKESAVFLLLCDPRPFAMAGFNRMADYLRERGAGKQTWVIYNQSRPYRDSIDREVIDGLESLAVERGLAGVLGKLPHALVIDDMLQIKGRGWRLLSNHILQEQAWRAAGGDPLLAAATEMARRVIEIAGI